MWFVAAFAAAFGLACTPSIGDACTISTDCSANGDRLCDTSQPGGYCTIFSCGPNGCPNDGVCAAFDVAAPGCSYNDREVGRTARSFCLASCDDDADCRDGFRCEDLQSTTVNALILDKEQNRKVCLAIGRTSKVNAPDPNAPVCGPAAPPQSPLDASTNFVPTPDAGADSTTPDAGIDAGSDATVGDAGATDASDAGAADSSDASDATSSGG